MMAPDANAAKLRRAALLLQNGQHGPAERLTAEVLGDEPDNAMAHTLEGMRCVALGLREAAIESFDRALTAKPELVPVAQARADICRDLGRHEEAVAGYTVVLAAAPENVEALLGRAGAQRHLQRGGAALADYDRALALRPLAPAARIERARVLVDIQRVDDALDAYSELLAEDPRNADAHNGRGVVLRGMRQYEAALESFAAALRNQAHHIGAINNCGLTLHDLNRSEEAITHLENALAIQPQHKPSLHNLGMILHSIDRSHEAAQYYSRLVEIAPDFHCAAGSLARARLAGCDWTCFQKDLQRISDLHDRGACAADPMTALMVTDSAAIQFECARRFAAREYPASSSPLSDGVRYRHGRIRIAYLSADIHDHPVAHLLAGVLEHHDRQQFETIGVSLRRDPRPGAMHARLRQAFEHFHDVAQLDDREVASRLRRMEVDIAVDLTGFTRGGRLGILALRPAPVQVNYLGFAGTYGAPYVDYVIADREVIPTGEDVHFSERIVRLPHAFMPNDDRQNVAADGLFRQDCGLPRSGFVYCAFSNAYKIVPPLFDVWMHLLHDTPGSVLWLRSGPSATVNNLRREAWARGVAPERLVFAPRVNEMAIHLARYRLADLFLDTSPYGAHATARDALWAGLPLVTQAGGSFASRVAASLLTALDLRELVAESLAEYRRLALRLAQSPEELAELRGRLARGRAGGPPFDTDVYRRHLETAYRRMWENRQRGAAPESFDVAADSVHANAGGS